MLNVPLLLDTEVLPCKCVCACVLCVCVCVCTHSSMCMLLYMCLLQPLSKEGQGTTGKNQYLEG